MATVAGSFLFEEGQTDRLSGTMRAHALDRWIYVAMAGLFIVIVLVGFIPDSLQMIASDKAGEPPPIPPIMHVHAVLMGSFLLLLLAQTTLVAIGKSDLHRRLGLIGMVLAPALVIVGLILAPTIYHSVWNAAHLGPPPVRAALMPEIPYLENVLLLQIRVGILFPVFIWMGLRARSRNPGFHKRMMILATAITLVAAIDRISWLPTIFDDSPAGDGDLYMLLVVAPMFVWDVARNRSVHSAYLVWLAIGVPVTAGVYALWDTAQWHTIARQIMGV
jgi:hypothetical protein